MPYNGLDVCVLLLEDPPEPPMTVSHDQIAPDQIAPIGKIRLVSKYIFEHAQQSLNDMPSENKFEAPRPDAPYIYIYMIRYLSCIACCSSHTYLPSLPGVSRSVAYATCI